MLATLLSMAIVGQSGEARLFERLPNEALIYSERIENSDRVSVQLWISSRGTEERPETNGYRHLIEHFLAKSQDKFTDENGIFLSAETTREAMAFKVEAPPQKLSFAIQCLRNLFQPVKLTPELIAKEVQIIRHEEATVPSSRLFSRAGWAQVFGGKRPDPMGDFDLMAAASPADLETLRARMFATSNLVVAACGALEPRAVVGSLSPFLAAMAPLPPGITKPDPDVTTQPPSVGAQGSALAVRLEGVDRSASLARLAVGFAITQAYDDIQMTYTVSAHPGLMTLSSSRSDIADLVGGLTDRQLSVGSLLLARWAEGIGRTPTRLAAFRGALLAESSTLNIASIQKTGGTLQFADLKRAHQEVRDSLKLEGFK